MRDPERFMSLEWRKLGDDRERHRLQRSWRLGLDPVLFSGVVLGLAFLLLGRGALGLCGRLRGSQSAE